MFIQVSFGIIIHGVSSGTWMTGHFRKTSSTEIYSVFSEIDSGLYFPILAMMDKNQIKASKIVLPSWKNTVFLACLFMYNLF